MWWDMLGMNETDEDGLVRSHGILDQFRFTSWHFCHARGSWNDQLAFHVKKGKCIPDELVWADEICDELMVESSVTLEGSIALSGISSEVFSTASAEVIVKSLSTVVTGWVEQKLSLTSTSLDARSLSVNQRALNSYTHDVYFTVSFISENLGVDGTIYANVENLVNEMSNTLEFAFASGSFMATLPLTTARDELLGEIAEVELVSLEISDISYSKNNLVYYYDEKASQDDNTGDSQSLSGGMIALFAVVGSLALVAVVGVVAHGFNGYKKLSTVSDSDHRFVAESARSDGVEMGEARHPFSSGMEPKRLRAPAGWSPATPRTGGLLPQPKI